MKDHVKDQSVASMALDRRKRDLVRGQCTLARATEACHRVASLHDFKAVVRDHVRPMFPHEAAVCGIGEIKGRRVLRLVNIDYPTSYLQGIIRPDQSIRSCLLETWLCQRAPILVLPDSVDAVPASPWLQMARRHRLRNIAAHGLVESSGHTFCFFAFANLDGSATAAYARVLRELVPQLYAALSCALTAGYLRSIDGDVNGPPRPATAPAPSATGANGLTLSRRENEILRWVREGKTNWEIAHILNLSEHTVKNHVRNILRKLGVVNRVQAAGNAPR